MVLGGSLNSYQADNTALLAAAQRSHIEVVHILLENGADLNAMNGVRPCTHAYTVHSPITTA